MVRGLASHHCGPGSIPGLDVICRLSLLLVLVLAPRVFCPGTPVFPPSSKTNISKFQFDLGRFGQPLPTLSTENKVFIIYYLFIISTWQKDRSGEPPGVQLKICYFCGEKG